MSHHLADHRTFADDDDARDWVTSCHLSTADLTDPTDEPEPDMEATR